MKTVGRQLACIGNHTFLAGPVTRDVVVIDAGANVGLFATGMVEQFGCRVVAVEPHPNYCAQIPARPGISKVCGAIADRDGQLPFHFDDNVEGSRLVGEPAGESVTVDAYRLETLADTHDVNDIALVKLDIEGAELAVLDGLSDQFLARVDQFTVEFHDFAGYYSSARVEETLARLAQRGCPAIRFSRKQYGDTLIVNQSRLGLSAADWWWLRNVARNSLGIRRWLSRKLAR